MRTYLQIRKISAETGYVTNYMLTNEKASPRFGGQVAHDSFKHLENIGLLKSKPAISVKKRPRRDLILTPKGIIVCMALPEFQQVDRLNQLLERPYYKESKLALLLKKYNEGLMGPDFVKNLACRRFNLEHKTEDDIVQDLETIDASYNSMKLNQSETNDLMTGLLLSLREEEARILFQNLINKMSNDNQAVVEQISKIRQNFVYYIFREGIASIIAKGKSVFPDLLEIVYQRILESKVEFKDEDEKFQYAKKILQELIISRFTDNKMLNDFSIE